jgi:hypothetical protein
MSEKELEAKIAALEAKVAAQGDELRALRERANPPSPPRFEGARLGMEPPFSPSTYAAMDRMTVPKHITEEMTRNVSTEMLRQIVRDGKARE